MFTESGTRKCPEHEDCSTKYLTADLYCCLLVHRGCRHGLPFGNEVFCKHPDRIAWSRRHPAPMHHATCTRIGV